MKINPTVFEYPLTIREFHIDTLQHVNNATYLAIFEEARWELCTKNGWGLKEVHEKQKSPIILEINIRFKREVHCREKTIIKSRCIEYEGKTGKLEQILFKENGEEACSATIIFGFFDLKTRKLILPTPEWLKAIGMD
ncbi:MAG: acyl-CoA thioesterase [Oligoflexia bacterium]|nr:acyl-CoA thioesterase [Oligoflexia bacterium]